MIYVDGILAAFDKEQDLLNLSKFIKHITNRPMQDLYYTSTSY